MVKLKLESLNKNIQNVDIPNDVTHTVKFMDTEQIGMYTIRLTASGFNLKHQKFQRFYSAEFTVMTSVEILKGIEKKGWSAFPVMGSQME